MRITVLLLFLFAQLATTRTLCQEKEPLQRQISFVIAPTILNIFAAKLGVQTGLGFAGSKWGGTIEAAFPIDSERRMNRVLESRYVRLGAELKKFIVFDSKMHVYLSLQTNYAIRKVTDSLGAFASKDSAKYISYDRADYSSPIFSNAIKLGVEEFVGKRFVVDGFFGIGIRTISTEYSNVVNPQPSVFTSRPYHNRPPIFRTEKSFTRLHLSGGVRLGYLLWRR